ncbi:MAG: polysaccharide deacetylase family protein, partial [bacterium]
MPLANTVHTYGRKLKDQRWTLARWRLRTERALLSVGGRQRPRASGRVLSYHSTGTPEWGVNDVAPGALLAQFNEAHRLGYSFVPASRVADGLSGPRELAVTFDDGLRSIMAVTPALKALGIPFTVFVVTDWASDPGERFLSWGDLERLAAAGAEIGSHSRSHPNFRDLPESLRI